MDQTGDLYHRRRWTDVLEELSVRPPDLLPLGDVGDIGPGADTIAERGTGLDQCFFDDLQRTGRLYSRIAWRHYLAVRPQADCTGYMHGVANPHRPGIAHHRFPRCATRNVLPAH